MSKDVSCSRNQVCVKVIPPQITNFVKKRINEVLCEYLTRKLLVY